MTMMSEWIGPTAAAVSLVSNAPRLLRASMAQVAGWRERRAVTSKLSGVSDRKLADIVLNRMQIDQVFGPRLAQERDTPHRVADALVRQRRVLLVSR